MRKGISPLIASVLLLAVTLSIASIFSGWGPDIVRTVTDETGNQTEQTISCNQASLSIESAKYFTGDGETSVVIRNTGTSNLDEVLVSAWQDNLPMEDAEETVEVDRGDFETINLTTTSGPDRIEAFSRQCSDVWDDEEEIN